MDLFRFFGCGSICIDNRKTDGLKYIVNKRCDLIKFIIPHFEKYPLVGSKYLDYIDFKTCVLLMDDHSKSNRDTILSIKKGMNRGRPYNDRWNYLKTKVFDLKPQWVQAFIDGQGSFICVISDAVTRGSGYVAVKATLEIAQNSHDVAVLNAILKLFGIGYLKAKYDITSLEA